MRLLIVEDERVIAQRLERFLRELAGADLQRLEVCETVEAAGAALDAADFDAVFLDLNVHGQDGFDVVAERLADWTARPFHVVVVSGHSERALEAFDHGVLDFVPKPFGIERLTKTFERLRGARAERPARALALRSPGRIDLVPVDEIVHVRASGSYAELVLADGDVRHCTKPLDRLLAVLPSGFQRIHRAHLVRLDAITRIRVERGSRYFAVLSTGEELPIGRTRVDELRRSLGMP